MPITCSLSLGGSGIGFNPVALGWALAAVGYGVGLLLHFSPTPGARGREWGGLLMSYSFLSAGFLAVASLLSTIPLTIQGYIPVQGAECEQVPGIYLDLGTLAYEVLAVIAGVGMGSALIPIVGPAIANMFSVVSVVPSMILSGVMIIAFTLTAFLTVFGTLAPILFPVGVALMAFPAGKLKGLGAWMIAAALVFATAAPFIPYLGSLACGLGDPGAEGCDWSRFKPGLFGIGEQVGEVIKWIFAPAEQNGLMKMWRFALGSMAGWGILMLASMALSRGIGGIAASLGFG